MDGAKKSPGGNPYLNYFFISKRLYTEHAHSFAVNTKGESHLLLFPRKRDKQQ
jgi:hypothetical protein